MSGVAEAFAAVGDAAGVDAPLNVRVSVLSRAFGSMPSTVVAPCSPLDAYLGAAADIAPLLVGGAPDLVAHVVGIEELVLRWARGEHVEVDAHAAVRSDATTEAWAQVVRDVAVAVRARPSGDVDAYGLPLDVDGLLVLRTFELWTHQQDLSGAVPATDPARLALMASRLADVLPLGMAVRGTTQPGRSARLVVTGVAPGCFDLALDPAAEPGEPDVTIVVDVVDVCRLAARRLDLRSLTVVYEGDAELGRAVLTAADTFAQD